ncbi:MAG: bifunctional methylenetetrahydrofolate dehydrogenase/methenyltetrahydrofolate cyclohydrolase FolD [Bacteroidales bacterium]|jgi:methylenetetrahydrofolate dehydrogenase (NADP+)/methenyltetrahydrofolate cyclohydrolase|nr:bifunctional methylenetetrahydrofolate dehydrogenase/methenyltetrahydrofolate cyclohydrolase FolD [Bacteroidales bacterium]MDD3701443.1 bifunctional methylenetetrahydrofolate dehydrogenase/methenyltetrahydrofolate cyclohydrolase FolD [Bacteroidales bacterium]MDY0369963.1 bifunctional methylenetetrahydrofolate dehydrogenase/methenyltetrahydrofolate cyclohydrolase FolD [Bacteroidales bacterium]
MKAKLIDGKSIAELIKKEIATEVASMIDQGLEAPHLAAILVGNDPASETYVAAKERACRRVGMTATTYRLPARTSEKELLSTIEFLNNDPDIDGFIVQLPLPAHIDTNNVIEHIAPEKDVDGFHPRNIGRMLLGLPAYLPATPAGIMELLERSNIEVQGTHCVIIGRSNIVGTPLSILLSRKTENANATVTLCHSHTTNLAELTRQADILIVAIGQPEFLKADMIKPNAVVIDVGIHRIPDAKSEKGYRITGDAAFKEVAAKASAITPVPGGVGPMTIASLLKNTLLAAQHKVYKP